jgi:hypothetical protein
MIGTASWVNLFAKRRAVLVTCHESDSQGKLMDNLEIALTCKKATRAMLAHQLELLENDKMHTGIVVFGDMVEGDIKRTKSLIAEYDECIADLERGS